MRIIHKLIFFIVPLSFVFSQNEMQGYIVDAPHITTSSQRYTTSTDIYLPDDVIGSPFVIDAFQPGIIYEKGNAPIENLYFRYNSYEDDIEVKKNMNVDNKDINILTKSSDILVKISNNIFVFNEEINGYSQILFQGNNFKLYKQFTKKLIPAKRAITSFDRDILASFEDRIKYFLYATSGEEIYEIPPSKRKRIKFFGNKQTEINKYVKKYKLDIEDEAILIKIVRYFDSFEDATLK
jgi:hypothetical protein